MDDIETMQDMARRAALARKICPFITTKQAAFHLGLSCRTLQRLRASGKGPRCRMHTRAWRYHIDDLEAWSVAHARGGDDV